MTKLVKQDRSEDYQNPFDQERDVTGATQTQNERDCEERYFDLDGNAKEFHRVKIR